MKINQLLNKLSFLFFVAVISYAQNIKIVESTDDHLILNIKISSLPSIGVKEIDGIKFNYFKESEIGQGEPGKPWLPYNDYRIALPPNSNPRVNILDRKKVISKNKFILPYPDHVEKEIEFLNELKFDENVYSSNKFYPSNPVKLSDPINFRFNRYSTLLFYPVQFNPSTRELIFNKELTVRIDFNREATNIGFTRIKDLKSEEFLNKNILNGKVAKKWIGKISSGKVDSNYWYLPEYRWFKILVEEKGVYRITYEDLASIYSIENRIPVNNIAMYANEKSIPIDIEDKGDNYFDAGDYLQFVGFPPPNSPHSGLNIYQNQNIYWLTIDEERGGNYYKKRNGHPVTWDKSFIANYRTLHYEKDTLYERLGLAINGDRDHWYWGKVSGDRGLIRKLFTGSFPPPSNMDVDKSKDILLRVSLHGITNDQHKAQISLTSHQLGEVSWSGQSEKIYEKVFSIDTVGIFDVNNLQVITLGDIPGVDYDEIRVNWFEIEFWQENRVLDQHFEFVSPPNTFGNIRYHLFKWLGSDMKVYVPSTGKLITNVQQLNDGFESFLFVDTVRTQTEYFAVSSAYYKKPKVILTNKNSNLRDNSNGADYLIITHSKFFQAAEKLKAFREENLYGFDAPRVKVVTVNDIYNEFSGGLLDPYAIQKFVKYTFENWQSPPPSYLVLLGDMSWDYRHIYPESRENFIPSIPYHGVRFGEAACDNLFGAVVGNDVVPDLAIGRLSCETVEEADILVNKIIQYPGDESKQWKQNVLLISGGQSASDENQFKFNYNSIQLDKEYISPNGYSATKIFTYINQPDYQQYEGTIVDMRAGFDKGAVIANYYGHGGGYQWDLVFLTDDIYQLNNEYRMPFISSITCYTAHFDNQNVFGEQFNKIENRGSIGFWGHTGIAFWDIAVPLNKKMFNQIFNNSNFVIGDAIAIAKADYPGNLTTLIKDHIVLLTLLGDPALKLALPEKPDFSVSAEGITLFPEAPLVGDSVTVTLHITNFGRHFWGDSVTVQLFENKIDSTHQIGEKKIDNFLQKDSVKFIWHPQNAGLVNLIAVVNEKDIIPEEDHSDNYATSAFAVYNVQEPAILTPLNGVTIDSSRINFILADASEYIGRELKYVIEIDTSTLFQQPILKSNELFGSDGLVEWHSGELSNGEYFWRAKIIDDLNISRYSEIRTFKISSVKDSALSFSGKQLQLFQSSNMVYDDSAGALKLQLADLPPKPSDDTFESNISLFVPDDIISLSALATDGTYLYFAHIAYPANIPSKIYKLGTGFNGTTLGVLYGTVGDRQVLIRDQMFYYNGSLYIPDGNPYSLIKLDVETGDSSRIAINEGMLNATDTQVHPGAFYLATDGKFVYNLAYLTEDGAYKYTLRTFDPNNNWAKVGSDQVFSGTSYEGFRGFFAAKGYIYPYEGTDAGFMRRLNLKTLIFEEEWLTSKKFKGYYAWVYDQVNDKVYASVFYLNKQPMFTRFAGSSETGLGSLTSMAIGPAINWDSLSYSLTQQNMTASYTAELYGFNVDVNEWQLLDTLQNKTVVLSDIDADKYPELRFKLNIVDSSLGTKSPFYFSNLKFYFGSPAEVLISKNSIQFPEDSLMQGFDIPMQFSIKNIGYADVDSLNIQFFLNESDSAFITQNIKLKKGSTFNYSDKLNTTDLLFDNVVKVTAVSNKRELFTFNNLTKNTFYVARDSLRPNFNITFDGEDILPGDIVSSNPFIVITLSDNSPLPIDTTDFYLYLDNRKLSFIHDSLDFSYIPYPNSQARIEWSPKFNNGTHILEVFAKDASGNFFDSTSYRVIFKVNSKNEIFDIYNYPNPFNDITYFTFYLSGSELPDKMNIKIYTIAGRLIRSIDVDTNKLKFGFNKIYWDGKDEDGDQIANGVYFYKISVLNNKDSFTEIKKMARVR